MKIGVLAKKAQCSVGTVRFYEQQGLLPEAARSSGNYRIYTDEHLQRLLLIRHCRALDMAQDEIRMILALMNDPSASCTEMGVLLDNQIQAIELKLLSLNALREQLAMLRSHCEIATDVEHCGIYHELASIGAE